MDANPFFAPKPGRRKPLTCGERFCKKCKKKLRRQYDSFGRLESQDKFLERKYCTPCSPRRGWENPA